MIPDNQLLTWLTFLPSIGALAVLLAGLMLGRNAGVGIFRLVALVSSVATFALALLVWVRFDPTQGALQLQQKLPWIPTLHVDYFVAVDGFSILLILLAALLVPMAILASWSVKENTKTYFFLVLVLETGMFGVFTALNFFHWFIFWELSLIPAFFLIKMWGGERANRAALKFFLYTLVGSVTMLLAFQAIYLATGTFDFTELAKLGNSGVLSQKLHGLALSAGLHWSFTFTSVLVFSAVLLGFAVKAPLWPFHTWLPDAYAEAPAPITMLLTGVLSKMGVYGILRIVLPIFPQYATVAATFLLLLALMTVIAGAFTAYAQKDLKRMLAYSSVNHVGYCLLGIFAAVMSSTLDKSVPLDNERAAALQGVILQMFNHGITAAAMFFFVGILEERAKMRGLDDFGGLRKTSPLFCGIFGIALFSSLGLPGLNGFVSEFLIFKGVLSLHTPIAAAATVGIVVTAIFLLTIMQRVFWGPLNERWSKLGDLSRRELFVGIVFLVPIFWIGLYPDPFTRLTNATVQGLVLTLQTFTR